MDLVVLDRQSIRTMMNGQMLEDGPRRTRQAIDQNHDERQIDLVVLGRRLMRTLMNGKMDLAVLDRCSNGTMMNGQMPTLDGQEECLGAQPF